MPPTPEAQRRGAQRALANAYSSLVYAVGAESGLTAKERFYAKRALSEMEQCPVEQEEGAADEV